MCIKMNLDDTAKSIQFSDSACTCDHRIASYCIKASCSCCTESNHSMVLDGIVNMIGFAPPQQK
jgi:hypothetical protein